MTFALAIIFGPTARYESPLPDAVNEDTGKLEAGDWFNAQFDALGCVARNPAGKIVLRNVIIDVAKAAGMDRFTRDGDWASCFVRHCAAVFPQRQITIDAANLRIELA